VVIFVTILIFVQLGFLNLILSIIVAGQRFQSFFSLPSFPRNILTQLLEETSNQTSQPGAPNCRLMALGAHKALWARFPPYGPLGPNGL